MAAARTVVIALLTMGTPIWLRACRNLHAEDTIVNFVNFVGLYETNF